MPITFSAVTTTAVASDSATVTTPTAPGGGTLNTSHLIWAIVGLGDFAKWTGFAAAGWAEVRWQDTTTAGNIHLLVRQATASEPTGRTFGPYGGSSNNMRGVMVSTAGGDTADPFQTTSGTDVASGATSTSIPGLTPTTADAMLFWVGMTNGPDVGTGATASSTGTELFDLNTGALSTNERLMGGYYQQLSSASATGTRTVSYAVTGVGTNHAGIMVAMNPAATPATLVEAVGFLPLG